MERAMEGREVILKAISPHNVVAPSGSTASCKDLGSQGEEISFETITEWIAPTKTQEQRAAMNLSRPWWHQGKRQDARQLLAEFYGRLTEGIGTADL
jgi:hypothetical protein